MTRTAEIVDAVALVLLDRTAPGGWSLHGASLRALDAIHIAAAVDLVSLDGFLSYDDRQAAAAPRTNLGRSWRGV